MRSVVSRLARLERLSTVPSTAPLRLQIQDSNLEKLPHDYVGPRQTVTVKQPPPGPASDDRSEWEERLGTQPAFAASEPNEIVVQVCYVEGKAKS